ncbi:MAG: Ig-like domain-containing protein [Bacteroidia bacterium]
MIFKRIFFIPLLIFIVIICNRCAQVGPLSGGVKDRTPPQLLSVLPKDTSTNVPTKNTTLVFQFDEMVDIKSVQANMIINPFMEDKPDVRSSGKKMIIHFDEDLLPNTTYQIQFGKSIGDVHENNKYKNLTYLFSTGPNIDSNTVSGKTTWATTLKPAKDVSIMLYTNLDDTAATRTKPTYVVKTDSVGGYSLGAIKTGTYQIVAVTDKNNNHAYDLGEGLGFINKPLIITGKDSVNFIMSTPKSDKSFIRKKIQPFWGYNKYVLSDTMTDAFILLIEDSVKETDRSPDNDKLTYETKLDTLEVYYKDIFDTELKFLVKRNQTVFDTITLEVPKEAKVDSTISKHSKKIKINSNKIAYGISNDDVFFNFSMPIINIDLEKCSLIHDSTIEKPQFTIENKNETNNLVTTYLPIYQKRLLNKLVENKNYMLMFLPNSVTNYWGKQNADTIKTSFKTFAIEDVGTLKVTLVLPDSMYHYVLQLLSSSNNVITEYSSGAKKENSITFYNLAAADYYLRLINDIDANKKFTPANFATHTQPETLYLYNKLIKVPAGWDIETDWNILVPEKIIATEKK